MSLDVELLAAHAAGDTARLITLYTEAADTAQGDTACGFFLTHAYVFALEAGDPRADALGVRLRRMGRL